MNALQAAGDAAARKISAAIKTQAATGTGGPPDEALLALIKEARSIQAKFLCEIRRLQREAGVSECEIRVLEREHEAKRLPSGKDLWHHQVMQARATEELDELTAIALENLLPLAHPDWLRAEAKKPYRLDAAFHSTPLHLVSGVRVGAVAERPGPQRFARMLLLAQDHLAKHADFDFYAGAMFIPELALLGNSILEIGGLGPEAQRKFLQLPTLTDDSVTATIFELLVGAACLRRGLDVTMVPEDRTNKVPDFRVTGLGAIPGAIECKRRLGLTTYELAEAQRVETLYGTIRPALRERGLHCAIEVAFAIPVQQLSLTEFSHDVLAAASSAHDTPTTLTSWGSLSIKRLPFNGNISYTRLYSPDYLQRVFAWDQGFGEWDGLLCEVEPPERTMVRSFRFPMCLKWRSDSEEALTKRSRGIFSLWTNASKQIPDGEIGFIYIAYPEGARPSIADARTRHVLKSMEESWHRWSVRIPVSVISRLYPRPIGEGRPDLIESSLPGAAKGQEFWLTQLPWLVFTRQFEEAPGI